MSIDIDYDHLNRIYKNYQLIDPKVNNYQNKLKNIKQQISDLLLKRPTTVSYKYGSGKSTELGRLFETPNVLQNMKSEIRDELLSDKSVELDIVNCCPTILSQLCYQNNISCPLLTKYINDRQFYVKTVFNNDLTKCKFIINVLINGGDNYNKDNDFLCGFKEEIDNIHKQLVSIYKHLLNDKIKVPLTNKSFVAILIYTFENYRGSARKEILGLF